MEAATTNNMAERILSIELVGLVRPRPPYVNYLQLGDVREIVQERLGVQPDELDGVQRKGKKFEFGIKSARIFHDKNLISFLNQKYTLRNGKVVELTQAYEETTSIRVSKMPMFWDESKIERIFSWYGHVKKIEQEKWRAGYDDAIDEYAGIWNGNYRITMVLDKPIPSTLVVSKSKFEFFTLVRIRLVLDVGRPT